MKVINLFGGAGCGKSTLAAYLFATLKANGLNAELVLKYQKDLVYEEASSIYWNNQTLLFANQLHKLNRLISKVDIVITDNPILTNVVYRQFSNTPASLDNLVIDTFKTFDNINYLIKRDNNYFKSEGRIHTLEESINIDTKLLDLLTNNCLDFKYLNINEIWVDVINTFIKPSI